jgi:hypothetical protein
MPSTTIVLTIRSVISGLFLTFTLRVEIPTQGYCTPRERDRVRRRLGMMGEVAIWNRILSALIEIDQFAKPIFLATKRAGVVSDGRAARTIGAQGKVAARLNKSYKFTPYLMSPSASTYSFTEYIAGSRCFFTRSAIF